MFKFCLLNSQKEILNAPKKILIIRYGAIGDVVHTTNLFRAIRTKYPDIEIHYMTTKIPAMLIENDKDLNKVIIVEKKDITAFGSKELIEKLKTENYDIAINLQPNFKTKLLLFKSGIKTILTYRKDYKLHAVTNFYQTAKNYFPDIECGKELKLYLDEQITNSLKEKYKSYPRPFIVLSAGGIKSPRQGRCYPIEKWLNLGKQLQEIFKGTIFITGLNEDEELLSKLNSIPSSLNLVGQLSIKELMSLYNNCDLVISGDSGPLHIATAVGTEVIGLFGSMKVSRTGPFGTGHKTITSNVDCLACNRRKCKILKYRKTIYQKCMSEIQEQDIIKSAQEILQQNI